MRTRIGWASTIAVLGLALTLAFVGAQGATAVQGMAVIAGQANTATNLTVVQNTGSAAECSGGASTSGLLGCGYVGLQGNGTLTGVYGRAPQGVLGIGTGAAGTGLKGLGDTGVLGYGITGVDGGSEDIGNGVWGHTKGSGSGVYGETSGTGYGVLGYAPSATAVRGQTASGIGVLATAGGGTALKVTGKSQFSRSGLAVVGAGKNLTTVSNVALTSGSIVLATVQDQTAVGVKAVVRDLINHSFRIVLTKAATFNTSVGWFIVETP